MKLRAAEAAMEPLAANCDAVRSVRSAGKESEANWFSAEARRRGHIRSCAGHAPASESVPIGIDYAVVRSTPASIAAGSDSACFTSVFHFQV
jgi:hypothetical protein